MYQFRASENKKSKLRAQLFGSGAILREALKAQEILEEKYGVAADVWSVTSYKALYNDGIETERWNLLHPGEKPRVPYVTQCLADAPGVLVAAIRLSESAAQHDQPSGCRAASHRSAPTDSAAAKAAHRCATSSKWMRASSCWPRCMNFSWRED